MAFLPSLAEDVFDAGSSGFGLLMTATAIGALAVTLALSNIKPERLGPVQAVAALAFGITLVFFVKHMPSIGRTNLLFSAFRAVASLKMASTT